MAAVDARSQFGRPLIAQANLLSSRITLLNRLFYPRLSRASSFSFTMNSPPPMTPFTR